MCKSGEEEVLRSGFVSHGLVKRGLSGVVRPQTRGGKGESRTDWSEEHAARPFVFPHGKRGRGRRTVYRKEAPFALRIAAG